MSVPLQSLASPRFAVPFGAAVLGGVALARYGRRVDARAADATYRAAGAGLAAGGLALAAFGLDYAGTFARLVCGAGVPTEPSTLGRLGLALPWAGVAGALCLLSVAGFALALGSAILDGIRG